jgi:glyceraldehyde-3-phosphate dehydrogenase/erythrose-4-phosphate dehydrogenase
VTDEQLVSADFNHNPNPATFDLTGTQIVDGKLVRVLAWYDNEWGPTAWPTRQSRWASCCRRGPLIQIKRR